MGDGRSEFNKAIGAQIKTLREQAELTQDALALKLRELGLGWTGVTLTKVELGTRSVKFSEIAPLVHALDVKLADLAPDGWLVYAPGSAIDGRALATILG